MIKTSLGEFISQVIEEKTQTQRNYPKKNYFFNQIESLRPVKKCVDEIYFYLKAKENTDEVFRRTIIVIICLKYFWNGIYSKIVEKGDYFDAMTQEIQSHLKKDAHKNVFEDLCYMVAGILDSRFPQSSQEHTEKYQDVVFCNIDLLERSGWKLFSYQHFNLVEGYHLVGIFLSRDEDLMYVNYEKFYNSYVNYKIQCAVDYCSSGSKPMFTNEQRAIDLLFSEVLSCPKEEWAKKYISYSENYFHGVYYEKFFNDTIYVMGISSAIVISRAMYVCDVGITNWKKYLEMLFETDILRDRDDFNFSVVVILCSFVATLRRIKHRIVGREDLKNVRRVFVYMVQQFNKLVGSIKTKRNLNRSIVYWQFLFYSLQFIGEEYVRSGMVSLKEDEICEVMKSDKEDTINKTIKRLKDDVKMVSGALNERYIDSNIANVGDIKDFIELNLEMIDSGVEMDIEVTQITTSVKSYGSVFDELIKSGQSRDEILKIAIEKINLGEWKPWYYDEIIMELRRRKIE